MAQQYLRLGMSLLIFLFTTTPVIAEWQQEVIDTNIDLYSSLAVNTDDNGTLKVSYADQNTQHLKYANQTATGWQIDIDEKTVEAYTILDIDSQGYHHKLYVNDNVLIYSNDTSGAWQPETIATLDRFSNYSYSDMILTIDHQGKAHILATKKVDIYAENVEVFYATNRSGEWIIDVIYNKKGLSNFSNVFAGHILMTSNLSIDTKGNAHIGLVVAKMAFICLQCGEIWGSSRVLYMTNRSGKWKTQQVKREKDFDNRWIENLVISVNDKGRASILYSIDSNEDSELKYAHNSFGFWKVNSLGKSIEQHFMALGIAVDSNGHKHIVYGENNTVIYAKKMDGEWSKSIVYQLDNSQVGFADGVGSNSEARHIFMLDTQDQPHLIYESDNGINHATIAAP